PRGHINTATRPRSKPECRSSSVGSWRRCGTASSSVWRNSTQRFTGDGSTRHLPPNKPGQQKPSKDAGAYRFLLRAEKSILAAARFGSEFRFTGQEGLWE